MNNIITKLPPNQLFKTCLLIDLEYRPEDAAELYKDETFTGLAYDHDEKTGTLIEEVSYWHGGVHGFVKQWHPNGQVKFESRYFHGGFAGESRGWHENGQLKKVFFTWGGNYIIKEKIWDEFGNLIKEYYIKNDMNNFSYYIKRKRSVKETLPLRRNWASLRRPGLIDFNKRIQLYLRDHPFTAIEPKKVF